MANVQSVESMGEAAAVSADSPSSETAASDGNDFNDNSASGLLDSDAELPHGDFLLCLDGGGIRGLVLAQLLRGIERRLPSDSVGSIADCFDWIAGTSTGGLAALALASGKSARFGRGLYLRTKEGMFHGSRPYSDAYFEEMLKELFGEATVMTDLPFSRCGVMVMALLADRFPPLLHVFRNYEPPLPLPKPLSNRKLQLPGGGGRVLPPDQQLVWKAARASGAAPTFFPSCEQFLDGGLVANNPTLDAVVELTHYYKKHHNLAQPKLSCVVSLGTGRPPVLPISDRDIRLPSTPGELFSTLRGVGTLAQIMVEQACSADYQVVRRAEAWCQTLGAEFYRLSPPLSADIPMDCIDNSVLLQLMWETEVYIFRRRARFARIAAMLAKRGKRSE